MDESDHKTLHARAQHTSTNRREEILEAAVAVFAESGYYRATTAQVAERVGISQPYVYRFFETKEALFLAALERATDRIVRVFSEVQASPEQLAEEMGRAYVELTRTHRNEIVLQVQAQGIRDEPIRQAMRSSMRRVKDVVTQRLMTAGIRNTQPQVSAFLAKGMLCNVAAVLGMPELTECL